MSANVGKDFDDPLGPIAGKLRLLSLPSLLHTGFHRPLWGMAVLGAVAIVVLLFVIARENVERLAVANERLAVAQNRQAQLGDYLRLSGDMGGDRSLLPYRAALAQIDPVLDSLEDSYRIEGDAESLKIMESLRRAANPVVQSGDRALVEFLQRAEKVAAQQARLGWDNQLRNTRWLSAGGSALNIVLVLVAAMLVRRQMKRGDDRLVVLDEEVRQRADELAELSSHLQRVRELEKASLARELHDELGGVLIASKMDLNWLQRRLPDSGPDILLRLKRIGEMIDAGVDFKRRVVENLRPTLLDNLGLFAALRWMLEETCERSGLHCEAHLPEEEPVLGADASIAVYRIVQESVANVLKHAGAQHITVTVAVESAQMVVVIHDDGRGMPNGAIHKGAHGQVNMRHHARSLGGTLVVASVLPTGTAITVRIPLHS